MKLVYLRGCQFHRYSLLLRCQRRFRLNLTSVPNFFRRKTLSTAKRDKYFKDYHILFDINSYLKSKQKHVPVHSYIIRRAHDSTINELQRK